MNTQNKLLVCVAVATVPLLIAASNPNCTMYELTLPCIPSSISPTWSDCSVDCRPYYSCPSPAPNDQWCVDSYDEMRDFDHLETSGPSIFGYSCQQYQFPDSNCATFGTCGNQMAIGAPITGGCTIETCGGSCD